MVSTAPADLLHQLEGDPDLVVGVFNSWLNIPLMINVGMAPTDNRKFRQGLTYIMDYAAIANDIYGGYGSVPKSCVPQAMWGAGEHDVAQYDLEKAKMLLEESGVPKPWKVTYHAYTGRQEIMQIAELYQALAAQVGVEVELLTGEWPVLWKKQTKQESAANMFAVLWWADWPTPAGWLETMFRSEDPIVFNFSHYSNPDYDVVLDEALRLQGSDQAMAVEKFMEAQRIAYDDAVAMCLVDLQEDNPAPGRPRRGGLQRRLRDGERSTTCAACKGRRTQRGEGHVPVHRPASAPPGGHADRRGHHHFLPEPGAPGLAGRDDDRLPPDGGADRGREEGARSRPAPAPAVRALRVRGDSRGLRHLAAHQAARWSRRSDGALWPPSSSPCSRRCCSSSSGCRSG